MTVPWYKSAFRRVVVDMHITDHDPRFLSAFDADQYVGRLVEAQVQSAVVYAHSHVGLCYYPTRIGRQHPNLKGRDLFAEVLAGCHRAGIAVVAYYSLIFDCWAYDQHPDWRIIRADGQEAAAESRYGVCCPNSPYRDYAAAMVAELCAGYAFEGIRLDMTFWPTVCYCPHCQARYAAEIGGQLPRVVNWEDPVWTGFQRRREAWLADFAALITGTVKRIRPSLSVEHQASTFTHSWVQGVTESLAAQNTFLEGDFYGDALQGSFVRKLLTSLSPDLPYGFETSTAIDLGNHTALKSYELLRAKALAAVADDGAFIFIDAIDPIGTLNPRPYERMGKVFAESRQYDEYRGGTPVQDVAIYWSLESKFDPADKGKSVEQVKAGDFPHLTAALGAARSLIAHHLPFGVITRKSLADLSRYQVLVLPEVLAMDAEEVSLIRAWVEQGGALYASRHTSLLTQEGERLPDFALADLFGVSYAGETQERFTYLAPAEGEEELFGEYTSQYPAGFPGPQCRLTAYPGTQVLGTLVLPYTDPADFRHFASIHSNPPGVPTGQPALVLHRYGRGKVAYAAAPLEASEPLRELFAGLIRRLSGPLSFQVEAPAVVEATLFHQEEKQRLRLCLINFQKDLPNIPVDNIQVRVRLDHRRVRRVLLLPSQEEIPWSEAAGYAVFSAPRLETFQMLAVDYFT